MGFFAAQDFVIICVWPFGVLWVRGDLMFRSLVGFADAGVDDERRF